MRSVLWMLCCMPALASATEPPDLRTTLLSGACSGCHGVTGQGANGIPSIDQRRSRAEFVALMRGYRTDQGTPTVMNRIARGYSDAEIDLLARRWAVAE